MDQLFLFAFLYLFSGGRDDLQKISWFSSSFSYKMSCHHRHSLQLCLYGFESRYPLFITTCILKCLVVSFEVWFWLLSEVRCVIILIRLFRCSEGMIGRRGHFEEQGIWLSLLVLVQWWFEYWWCLVFLVFLILLIRFQGVLERKVPLHKCQWALSLVGRAIRLASDRSACEVKP